jgi:hypothetical protein
MALELPGTLQHYEGDAAFRVDPDGHACQSYVLREKPRLEMFVIYGRPMIFYNKGVWVEALRLVFKNGINVKGKKTPRSISAKVTEYCHTEHGMVYDTEDGASWFIVRVSGVPYMPQFGGLFRLCDYIRKERNHSPGIPSLNTLNCYDSAGAIQTLCGALGVETLWVYQDPFGYINKTNLVGVGDCNNPFFNDPTYAGTSPVVNAGSRRRSGFGNHAFIAVGTKAHHAIRDACAGPHIQNENLREYLNASIDIAYTYSLAASGPPDPADINRVLYSLVTATRFQNEMFGRYPVIGINEIKW